MGAPAGESATAAPVPMASTWSTTAEPVAARLDAGPLGHDRHARDRPHLARQVLAQAGHRPDPRGAPASRGPAPPREHRCATRRSRMPYISHTTIALRISQPGSMLPIERLRPRAHPNCAPGSAREADDRDAEHPLRPPEPAGQPPRASRYHPSQISATWSGASRARQDSPTSRAMSRWSGSWSRSEDRVPHRLGATAASAGRRRLAAPRRARRRRPSTRRPARRP